MKTIITVILALCLIATQTGACETIDENGSCEKNQEQSQDQAQNQGQHQSATAVGTATAKNGNNTVSNNFYEKTKFATQASDNATIGSTSRPVPRFYIEYQADEDYRGDVRQSGLIGVSIPITYGLGLDNAWSAEKQRLRDKNLHNREKHQANIAILCMEIHSIMERTGETVSKELWERCAGVEHFNNDATMKWFEGKFGIRHSAKPQLNKDQFSHHSEPYTQN